ncbi:aryl-alcohol dehydrogenase-like predicted oxidoreductase [Bacillus ectoiniformans]|uniref:aldo/keto reductase n=1 Tax=Bacillus ectoiniformans TaxID=1494429 RepID=UPI00195DD3BE|nr:aldo/keto reductase [Bacillus ectoiniformans]MBM7648059.1 aryl-alcohol dehydrogenase-like predicted oxidoreductase [Bacillus ectoiniformans]
MKKNNLGTSGLSISELGLGCMSLGTDEKKARAIIEAALEEGITYFDTADLYDFGINEEIVGKALQPVRQDVIIATKVGNRPNEAKDGWTWDPSKKYIKEAVKNSLRRLQLNHIDLYQLHGGTIEDPIPETIEAFEELKSEGLIRAYGISSIRPNVIRTFASQSSIDSVMIQYSLLDRRPEEEVLPLLEKHGISAVTRGPVSKGLLTPHWRDKMEKVKEKGFLNYNAAELEELLASIEARLSDNRSMNGLAFRYNLHHPSVAAVVAGASSVEQVKENIRAVKEHPLSDEEFQLIQELTKANRYADHR